MLSCKLREIITKEAFKFRANRIQSKFLQKVSRIKLEIYIFIEKAAHF